MTSEQGGQPSERWDRIKQIFASALEREPSARVPFLDGACAGDAEMRREVESLLAAHQTSDTFLETPAAAVAASASQARGLMEGQTLGPYRILRTLGQGGMATVYLARDDRHHRPVALKVLHPELAHALGPERFLREIEVEANLTHPHILPLHDSGEAGGLLYYVMPYIEGESLRDRLRRETQLPVDDALQIAREVADALAYAHGHGVIHRDIKPENILLSGGHALVADFGIARAVGQADRTRLTETGMAVGTAAYMSPEQASARPDRRADRHLQPGLRGVRDAGRGATLYRADRSSHHRQALHRSGAIGAADASGGLGRTRLRGHQGAGTATRRPLRQCGRVRAGSAADRGHANGDDGASRRRAPRAVSRRAGDSTGGGNDPGARHPHRPGRVVRLAAESPGGRMPAARSSSPCSRSKIWATPRMPTSPTGWPTMCARKLSQVQGLQVIARSSSNEYRQTKKSQQQIARELGVDYLLTATVQWEKVEEARAGYR